MPIWKNSSLLLNVLNYALKLTWVHFFVVGKIAFTENLFAGRMR